MIPRTIPTWQSLSWQEELSQLITDPKTLLDMLQIDEAHLGNALKANKLFPLRTTLSYIQRIQPNTLHDPLLRQILPIGEELTSPEGYSLDPLAEQQANPSKGVIHKYHGRVLLIAASQCAINCRYCFRRHFDYQENTPNRKEWQSALEYIRRDSSIDEVILSGGDPLAIADKQLHWLLSELEKIPHLSRLRIHSRMPIVLPSRISDEFISIIKNQRLHPVMVVHCNHPQELDAEVQNVLRLLAESGVTMLNQSVLLKGVNDDPETLIELSHCLFSCRTLPYYLHLLDKVTGAAHFDLPQTTAIALHKALLASLPGYLAPKLVKEVPDMPSKIPINY